MVSTIRSGATGKEEANIVVTRGQEKKGHYERKVYKK
jgi:hypothetical protein